MWFVTIASICRGCKSWCKSKAAIASVAKSTLSTAPEVGSYILHDQFTRIWIALNCLFCEYCSWWCHIRIKNTPLQRQRCSSKTAYRSPPCTDNWYPGLRLSLSIWESLSKYLLVESCLPSSGYWRLRHVKYECFRRCLYLHLLYKHLTKLSL